MSKEFLELGYQTIMTKSNAHSRKSVRDSNVSDMNRAQTAVTVLLNCRLSFQDRCPIYT